MRTVRTRGRRRRPRQRPRLRQTPAPPCGGRRGRRAPTVRSLRRVLRRSRRSPAAHRGSGEPLAALARSRRSTAVPEIPDPNPPSTRPIIAARRRRRRGCSRRPLGAPISVTERCADRRTGGRSPTPTSPMRSSSPISDETRTMSKTHARLELRGDEWVIVDLGSTNGVLFATVHGHGGRGSPGVPERVGERFLLGDAEVRLCEDGLPVTVDPAGAGVRGDGESTGRGPARLDDTVRSGSARGAAARASPAAAPDAARRTTRRSSRGGRRGRRRA